MMRNIFHVAVFLALLAAGTLHAKEKGKAIFNGKDLAGWEGKPEVWSVVDGAIVGQTNADKPLTNNTFLIWKDGKLDNFRLTLEYEIEGGNSGVQYRSKVLDPAEWIVGGYQADIDSGPTYSGILYEEKGRGILAQRGERVTIDRNGKSETEKLGIATELQKQIHENDWNKYVIVVRGRRMKHSINGHLMSETVDRDRQHRADSGILALQVHAGPPMKVSFRNLRLEKLEPKTPKKAK